MLNLEAQVAHAKALLSNGARIEEQMEKRNELLEGLANVEEELAALLSDGQPQLPLDTATKRKCGKCGIEGHSARTCTATTGA